MASSPPRLVLLALCLLCQAVHGATSAELLDQLQDSMRAEQTAAAKNSPENQQGRYALAQLASLDLSNTQQAEQLLIQLGAVPMSENSGKLVKLLLNQLRVDRQARTTILEKSLTETIRTVGTGLLSAKAPADIDPLLEQLNSVRSKNTDRYSDTNRSVQEQLDNALRFAMQWQDYLAKLQAGDRKGAYESMSNLAQNYSNLAIVPRSELLERSRQPRPEDSSRTALAAETDAIAASIHTLDDLDGAIRKLRGIQAANPNQVNYDLLNQLLTLQRNYLELKAGLSTSISLEGYSNSSPEIIVPLKAQLLMVALPRYLNTSRLPKAGESPLEYLARVAAEAKAAKDWTLLGQSLDARKLVARTQSYGEDSQNLQNWANFQTALNQQKAGQYELAVRTYLDSLRGSAKYIPVEFVGEQLEAIRRDHPEEYESALQPRPGSGNYPPGSRPDQPVQSQRPTQKPSNTPNPKELKVPAPTSTPAEKKP